MQVIGSPKKGILTKEWSQQDNSIPAKQQNNKLNAYITGQKSVVRWAFYMPKFSRAKLLRRKEVKNLEYKENNRNKRCENQFCFAR